MKNLIVSILLLWFSCAGFACDNCNVYLNLSPNDYQNSIGFYMRQRVMFGAYNGFGEMIATRHASHGNDKAFWGEQVYEIYQTYELRGTYYHRERWKTTVILPIVNNRQKIGDFQRHQVSGIGDPLILQSYQLINSKKDTVKRTFSQRFTAGGGIKFPLGKTTLSDENGTPNLDLQPGTGSWDALLFSTYTAKVKWFGINASLSIRKNGRNQNNYRYGGTFNGTCNLFADLSIKKATFRLLGGIYHEKAKMDDTRHSNDDVPFFHTDTGGETTFANAGIQLYFRRVQVFGEFQQALSHDLNGYTQLLTRNRLNLGINYNF